jgi:hypothetical protein
MNSKAAPDRIRIVCDGSTMQVLSGWPTGHFLARWRGPRGQLLMAPVYAMRGRWGKQNVASLPSATAGRLRGIPFAI